MLLLAQLCGITAMVLFTAGSLFRFKPRGPRTVSNALVRVLGLVVVLHNCVACALLAPPLHTTQELGLTMLLVATVLFLSAWRASGDHSFGVALAPHAPELLVRRGPFRLVRHPFYVSYFLGYIGAALLLASPVSGAFALAMCLLYGAAAFQEERLIAGSALALEYAAYRREVGMFVPRLRWCGPSSAAVRSACDTGVARP